MTVIHQAGPWVHNRQECQWCEYLLADCSRQGNSHSGKRTPYPEGALIEVTPTYQAITLADRPPTCRPTREILS